MSKALLVIFSLLLAINPAAAEITSSRTVCRAGVESMCPRHDTFIGCADPISALVKGYCPKGTSTVSLARDSGGGQCGVSIFEITCTEAPVPSGVSTTLVTILGILFSVSSIMSLVWMSGRTLSGASNGKSKTMKGPLEVSEVSDPSRLLRWVSVIGGLIGLAVAAWSAFEYLSKPQVSSLLDFLVSKAFADDGIKPQIGWMIPWVAAAVLALMAISFLTALGTVLLVPDTKPNQARIKAADNIVKTFGGFFTGLATTLLSNFK